MDSNNVLKVINHISGWIWGTPLLVLLVGTGIYLTIRLGLLQFRMLPYALKLAFTPNKNEKGKGDISHFQALMTALAATIGTGNIVGVATAVILGGPGAIFWMWMTALVGMATKYAEAVLAVKYRVQDPKNGEMSGGPMYYIEKGLGMKWLGMLFAFFGAIAAFGIGNTVQTNAVANNVKQTFGISPVITGLVLTIFTALVILGGIRNIGKVSAIFVPIMAIFYVLGGCIIIAMNLELVPSAFALIFQDAFTGNAVAGGAIGAVIKYGVARGLFSNEAGLGSAPIAAAAAKTDYPSRQGLVSMTSVFLDTIVVCTITGLTLIIGDMYTEKGANAGALTSQTFEMFLGKTGSLIVTLGLIFFAYSTVIGWSYYGEKCVTYLFKRWAVIPYRIAFVAAVFIGAIVKDLNVVWGVADIMNGLMAIPNLIALLGLSGVVVYETKIFLKQYEKEKAMKKATKVAS
ncbi:alanine/glycine:cation symporter family protein [Massilibacterium senegalense]|uniref:alanine/glycine:cation symporter family protein n=1 Tax=Massilibacterium senegalense TaxID=1632858 RepID=UPI0007828BF2|nr:sodium:alanine symporter family protein [Massilibacterium senegalense]